MEAIMGSKLYTSPKVYSTMFVIGGCELPLEKNPYATIDVITRNMDGFSMTPFPLNFPIAVRSPMAYMHYESNKLYLFGGCKGYREHLSDVQTFDFTTQSWSIAPFKLHKERSCFML
jgi:hypothetical protein